MSDKHKLKEVSIIKWMECRNANRFYEDADGTLFMKLTHQIGAYKDGVRWSYFYACEFIDGELVILQHVLRDEVGLEPARVYRDGSEWGEPWYLPKVNEGMKGGPDTFTFHESDVEIEEESDAD